MLNWGRRLRQQLFFVCVVPPLSGICSRGLIVFSIISDLRQNLTFNCVFLMLLGIGVGFISLLLGTTIFGLPMFRTYFDAPFVVLLNLLPPILIMFLLYFISGRVWIAFTFPALITLALSMANFFKVQVRGDPFIISDFELLREASMIVDSYTLTMNWKIYLAIVAFVCGALFSVFILKRKLNNARVRVIASVVTLASSIVLYTTVYTNPNVYTRLIIQTPETTWSATRSFVAKGFLFPFIHTMEGALEEMQGRFPYWYDEHQAAQTLYSYQSADIPDEKKVNIISIMLEAYSDLSRFDVLDFEIDVYGPLHSLQAESFSGMVVANVFAGGTIDTERLFLTGNSRLTNFRSPTNSYVFYLRSQGYRTEGLHSGNEWFYDRNSINLLLGFEEYFFIKDFEDGDQSDAFFFPAIMEIYMSRDKSRPYFSFNVSYQNHGAYDSTHTEKPYVIARNGMSDESFNILNNYLSGIYDTNQHLERFIGALRYDLNPVVVLVFGDHMPWLGNLNSVYYELGMNIDDDTEEGFYNQFSTPYFIWANYAAKNVIGHGFTGYGGSFSPGFLMGELFRLCLWDGDGYMQALRDLKTSIDVLHLPLWRFRENGVLTETLSPNGLAAFRRFRMMEIYRLNNFSY